MFDHKVLVDDLNENQYSFDPIWQKVIFEKAPEDGARVDFYYSTVEDLPLSYPVIVSPLESLVPVSLSSDMGELDLNLGLKSGIIEFNSSEYQPGRSWLAEFKSKFESIGPVSLVMPDLLIEGSLELDLPADCQSPWELRADQLYLIVLMNYLRLLV